MDSDLRTSTRHPIRSLWALPPPSNILTWHRTFVPWALVPARILLSPAKLSFLPTPPPQRFGCAQSIKTRLGWGAFGGLWRPGGCSCWGASACPSPPGPAWGRAVGLPPAPVWFVFGLFFGLFGLFFPLFSVLFGACFWVILGYLVPVFLAFWLFVWYPCVVRGGLRPPSPRPVGPGLSGGCSFPFPPGWWGFWVWRRFPGLWPGGGWGWALGVAVALSFSPVPLPVVARRFGAGRVSWWACGGRSAVGSWSVSFSGARRFWLVCRFRAGFLGGLPSRVWVSGGAVWVSWPGRRLPSAVLAAG